jgi:hypothetical protein
VLNACPCITRKKHDKKFVRKHAPENLFIIVPQAAQNTLVKEEEQEKN